MSMLDRYKKKGGFFQLLNLIETSSKSKQDQFLNLIQQENPAWEEALRDKMLSFEKIFEFNPEAQYEVIKQTQTLTIAVALFDLPDENKNRILGTLSGLERRKIDEKMELLKPTPAEIITCKLKLVSEVRDMIKDGRLKKDSVVEKYLIPENIEDLLNKKPNDKTPKSPTHSKNDVSTKVIPDLSIESPKTNFNSNDQEIVLRLQREIQELQSEVNYLRNENDLLNNKLSQIRKIA